MKTQTYGLCDPLSIKYHPCCFQYTGEQLKRIYESAMQDYIRCRLNGGFWGMSDMSTFPKDGTYHCDQPSSILGSACSRPVRYTEGPRDQAWMEEHDRSYILSLEREGKLEEVEPNLRIEVPQLYEEAITMRKNFHLLSKMLQPDITKQILFPLMYHFSEREIKGKFIQKTMQIRRLNPVHAMRFYENSPEKKEGNQNGSFLPNFPGV